MTTPSKGSVNQDEDFDHVTADWIDCYLCGGEGTYECENPLECCDGAHTCQHCGGRGGFHADGEDDQDDEFCPNSCDHCQPDAWHGCVLPAGHSGYHSCEAS